MITDKQTDWFIFYKDQLVLQKDEEHYLIPSGAEAPIGIDSFFEADMPDGSVVRIAAVNEAVTLPGSCIWIGLRASYDLLDEAVYHRAGKAFELCHWDLHSRFCPACGNPTAHKAPIMKQCTACGYQIFPAVSPAVIVLIRKGEELLLVHARNFRGTFYGLVAGFLETGETLEQCVAREVLEETGLTIQNITYFGNQPWPFPSQLMIGFFADYAGGELKLQDEELSAGAFFTKANLPELPRKLSLARKMIDHWIDT